MRVIGIAFLLLFVPESLPHPQMRVESMMFELKQFFGTGPRQSWTEKFKSANPLRLLQILMPTKSTAGKDVQRNLIALASVNTIMFASVMGAMNVMMLYSEVRSFSDMILLLSPLYQALF